MYTTTINPMLHAVYTDVLTYYSSKRGDTLFCLQYGTFTISENRLYAEYLVRIAQGKAVTIPYTAQPPS